MRKAILTLAVLMLGATAAPAQQGWAAKMFSEGVTHDFGSVPHGAQLFHRFTVNNIYAVRMEITGIKSGCGCVTATAAKRVLEPRESTTIDVSMDARRFTGGKTVGIRVTVGSDEYASSAELRVSANSRGDIVFNPGEVNFGNVTRGQSPTMTIDVEYAGALNWQVSEVVAKDLPLELGIRELYRRVGVPGQPNGIGYQVKVTLKPEVPMGAFKEEIYLKTNDPGSPLVPILVEAMVQSSILVTPTKLDLGPVRVGEELMRRVVVNGNRPFRVLQVDGLGNGIKLEGQLAAVATPVQIITFRCQLTQPGEFRRELKIKTDLQETPVIVTIEGNGQP
jgi:hypothetical protein